MSSRQELSGKERDDLSTADIRSGRVNSGGLLNQDLMEELLANCPEAIIVADSEWRVRFVNRKAAADAKSQELVGMPVGLVLPAFEDAEVERQCRLVLEKRVTAHLEHQTRDGEWLQIDASPCRGGVAIYYRDITDAKRAEMALGEREAEVRDFLENAALPIHWVGPDGTILWANQAELRMLGYSREEYIGRNIAEFHVDEGVIREMLCRLANHEELHSYESRLRSKNGSIRDVAISSNVYFRNGQFIHTRCFTRDITEERVIAELQQRLAAIVESSDDAIISKDLNGIIRSWNAGAERLFGYKAEETIGRHISMLATSDVVDEIPNILERLSRGERIDHYQTKRRTKDGRVLSISLTVSPIHDSSGRVIGASKVARDVTEMERSRSALNLSNEALMRANADLEQFAYSASHDLQEPLRMVSTYAEMLQKKFGGKLGAGGDEYIGYLVEGAARMARLLHDLRAFAQASTMSLEAPAASDATEALRRSIANLTATVLANGASITYDPLPSVYLHEFQVVQLFQNIIGNAIRYRSQEPPKIHVSAVLEGDMCRFSVQDNGIGINPEYKERVFGIFKRLHTGQEYPGTGMGLAICQRIVQRAGGRIWVESEPGRGSTFHFTLPAAKSR